MIGLREVVAGVGVEKGLNDAVADGAVFMLIPGVYDVLALNAWDCQCSYQRAPLPIHVSILCDVFM